MKAKSAVFIRAGLGYYTAIIARMVGDSGKVTAIEYERELAVRAASNLSAFPQVRVLQGDGFAMPLKPSDAIYVNAGAARPADSWLDAMKDGGRMILPLTVGYTTDGGHSMTKGAIFLIERKGDDYYAAWKTDTLIYPAWAVGTSKSEASLCKMPSRPVAGTRLRDSTEQTKSPRNDVGSAARVGRWPTHKNVT